MPVPVATAQRGKDIVIRSTRTVVWMLCFGILLSVQVASGVDSPLRVDGGSAEASVESQSRSATAGDVLDRMTSEQRHLFDSLSELASAGSPIPTLCWMEGTDRFIVEAFDAIGTTHPFQLLNRWTSTATDGGGLRQGDPTNLTWSIVPDGTVTPTGLSSLVAIFDAQIPSWLSLLQTALDRWGQLSGLNYLYEPNDDGVEMFTASGVLGVRGDVRIGGTFVDGQGGILGYADFPNVGDMILDTSDINFFRDPSDDYLRLRNVVTHEAGHGLGLQHVESSTDEFLMEPFISVSFDGPQLDDIRGAHRHYGDPEEFPVENDDPQDATDLGTPGPDGILSKTDQSIDDNDDVDVHSFDVGTERPTVTSITVFPTGRIYSQGPQGGGQAPLDSRSVLDLQFELLGTNGIDVLGSASSTGLGEAEVLEPGPLPEVPGTYFVRTFNGGRNSIQIYDLEIAFGEAAAVEEPELATSTWLLGDATPNPLNSTVTISYEISTQGEVNLRIHDVRGRLVRTLVQGERTAGRYQVVWSGTDDAGRDLASGVYLYTLQTPAGRVSKQMVMMR